MALRSPRRNVLYGILLAGLLAVIWAAYQSSSTSQHQVRSLGNLLTALDERQVAAGTFTGAGDRVTWSDMHGHTYETYLPAGYAGTLVDEFHQDRLSVDVRPASSTNLLLSVVLPNLLLFLVIGGFMWYMLRHTQRRPPS
jgi:ATP-dependent Zn protease